MDDISITDRIAALEQLVSYSAKCLMSREQIAHDRADLASALQARQIAGAMIEGDWERSTGFLQALDRLLANASNS